MVEQGVGGRAENKLEAKDPLEGVTGEAVQGKSLTPSELEVLAGASPSCITSHRIVQTCRWRPASWLDMTKPIGGAEFAIKRVLR